MRKKKVLLCGTLYGQVYIPAIYQSTAFELVGLLANGSDRSIRLAEQNGVDLYDDPTQLLQPVDIACVAINETIGTRLGMQLMDQGCDILIEHPISAENITRLLERAENSDCYCHINSHFAELPPCEEFIAACQKHHKQHTPHAIQVQCNSRTLFSCLDILMRCFGRFELECLNMQTVGHYRHCTFLLEGIAMSLSYQHWRHAVDDSSDSPLGHQISITYPQGVLSLVNSFGPCLWLPLLQPSAPASMPVVQTTTQNRYEYPNVATLIQWRKHANQKALNNLAAARDNDLPSAHQNANRIPAYADQIFYTDAAYARHLCQLWSRLFEDLGFEICAAPDPAEQAQPNNTPAIFEQ